MRILQDIRKFKTVDHTTWHVDTTKLVSAKKRADYHYRYRARYLQCVLSTKVRSPSVKCIVRCVQCARLRVIYPPIYLHCTVPSMKFANLRYCSNAARFSSLLRNETSRVIYSLNFLEGEFTFKHRQQTVLPGPLKSSDFLLVQNKFLRSESPRTFSFEMGK